MNLEDMKAKVKAPGQRGPSTADEYLDQTKNRRDDYRRQKQEYYVAADQEAYAAEKARNADPKASRGRPDNQREVQKLRQQVAQNQSNVAAVTNQFNSPSAGGESNWIPGGGGGHKALSFTCRASADTIIVRAGDVYWGYRTVIEVPETTVTLTEDYQYVPLEVDLVAGTAEIGTPTTTKPQPEAGVFRIWLVKCRLIPAASEGAPGKARILLTGHVGNLHLHGVGA